jgi:hypothetical protein
VTIATRIVSSDPGAFGSSNVASEPPSPADRNQ